MPLVADLVHSLLDGDIFLELIVKVLPGTT
jgi:hypothetical protein